MRRRISNFTKGRYTKAIREVMDDLGRPVEVFKQPAKHECFNCYFDKLTGSSTNTCKWTLAEALQKQSEYQQTGGIGLRYKYFSSGRCPICKGKGFLQTQRKVWVKCKITWDPEFDGTLMNDSAGKSGSTSVELKTDPKYRDLFTNCIYMNVDDVRCTLSKPPIVRGIGEKSLLVILAFTTENITPPVDNSDKEY